MFLGLHLANLTEPLTRRSWQPLRKLPRRYNAYPLLWRGRRFSGRAPGFIVFSSPAVGRINPLPASTSVPAGFSLEELNSFLYADYAIGKFIRDTRGAGYFDNPLFVFVGDHGVHLRGQNLVPIDEYRVPALFLAPAHLEAKQKRVVISQIDLPPTIMGIVGGDYRNPFLAMMR